MNQLINPRLLFEKSGLREGMHVADFGCGRTGHVVFPAALAVGSEGIVYAVDVLKDALEFVHKRAEQEGFHSVHTVWADLDVPGAAAIPEQTLDIVFIINVLFHFDAYEQVLGEAARLLKDKARIVIVDWIKNLAGMGPSGGAFVDFGKVIAWARAQGWVVQSGGPMGQYHKYLILFRHK